MLENSLLIDIAEKYGTPVYVYDKKKILEQYNKLDKYIIYSPKKIYYACKANSNITILKILKGAGCFIDVVSPGELFLAKKSGFKPQEILFTGNNLTYQDMEYVIQNKVLLNIDSISQLEKYGKINPGSKVCIRINPDLGSGHHEYVITGGLESKFGIYYTKIDEIKKISKKYSLHIIGIHMHIGSGILNPEPLLKGIEILLKVAKNFPELDFIDIGGGLGIPYKKNEKEIDLELFGKKLNNLLKNWVNSYTKRIKLFLEPGRFLVGESGILLTKITSIKQNPKYKFVGVDTGFNHLIRPALYNSYHEICLINDKNRKKTEKVSICGNICENGDIFAKDIMLPELEEGDLLAIKNVGAYGYSMASEYNSRFMPPEVLVEDNNMRLIRRRGNFEDLLLRQVY